MEKVPMTVAGFHRLEEEIRRLKYEERPAVIAAISEARGHGDLSENAEYHAAKERQGWIEGQIRELEDRAGRAQVIDVSKLSGKAVIFGATVTVIDEETEQKKKLQIVGEFESDVKRGKISVASPLARAMIGKGKGDTVEVAAPGGARSYEITKVEFVA
jgi:transcription elongation factor GreA